MQKGFGGSIVDLLLKIVEVGNHKADTLDGLLNVVLYTHLLDKQTRDHFADILVEVIDGLEENMKEIIMYHLKADIESQIHIHQPPKDWEEMWIKKSKIVRDLCYMAYAIIVLKHILYSLIFILFKGMLTQ